MIQLAGNLYLNPLTPSTPHYPVVPHVPINMRRNKLTTFVELTAVNPMLRPSRIRESAPFNPMYSTKMWARVMRQGVNYPRGTGTCTQSYLPPYLSPNPQILLGYWFCQIQLAAHHSLGRRRSLRQWTMLSRYTERTTLKSKGNRGTSAQLIQKLCIMFTLTNDKTKEH